MDNGLKPKCVPAAATWWQCNSKRSGGEDTVARGQRFDSMASKTHQSCQFMISLPQLLILYETSRVQWRWQLPRLDLGLKANLTVSPIKWYVSEHGGTLWNIMNSWQERWKNRWWYEFPTYQATVGSHESCDVWCYDGSWTWDQFNVLRWFIKSSIRFFKKHFKFRSGNYLW